MEGFKGHINQPAIPCPLTLRKDQRLSDLKPDDDFRIHTQHLKGF